MGAALAAKKPAETTQQRNFCFTVSIHSQDTSLPDDRIPNRTAFSHFHPILTRPQDNDVNGHIAGATVHGFFETAIQAFLVEQADLDLRDGELAAFVVSSAADFFALPGFPDVLEVGLGVARLAGSTVEYRLALYRPGKPMRARRGRLFRYSSSAPAADRCRCPKRCR